MLKLWSLLNTLRGRLEELGKDEEGAALLEYTVLLVIILGGAIALIILAGGWVSTQWQALMDSLNGVTI